MLEPSSAAAPLRPAAAIADPALEQVPCSRDIRGLLIEIRNALAGGRDPESLRPNEAAAFCGVSLRQWNLLNERALCPAPSYAGDKSPRWSRTVLRAWIIDGMSNRNDWERRRDRAIQRVA